MSAEQARRCKTRQKLFVILMLTSFVVVFSVIKFISESHLTAKQMQCTGQRWDQYECQHWDKYKCQHCMCLSLQQRDLHQVVTTRRNLLSSMEAEPSRSQSISWGKFNLLEFIILLFLGVTYNWCVCLILNQCAYWKLWVVQNCITPVQVEDIWSHPLQSIALAEWKKFAQQI